VKGVGDVNLIESMVESDLQTNVYTAYRLNEIIEYPQNKRKPWWKGET
jgi:hypothetical protein